MKHRVLLRASLALVALATLILLDHGRRVHHYGRMVDRAKRLTAGMTVAEVKARMGRPMKVTVYGEPTGRLSVSFEYSDVWAASGQVATFFYLGRDSLAGAAWDGQGSWGSNIP